MLSKHGSSVNQGNKTSLRHFRDFFYLFIYLSILLIAAINIPKNVSIYYEERTAIILFGAIGIWRYAWWVNHLIRSFIYSLFIFPHRRKKANTVWNEGWRPKSLIFMMTTFKELECTTHIVLNSILNECKEVSVPVKLFIGTGTDNDEIIIEKFFSTTNISIPFEVVMVRQKLPGKRYAIGETLRAILRHGLEDDNIVIFMDGDTFLVPGCLRLCLPFFKLYSKMQALTTHEQSIVKNAKAWFSKWLDMRFIQRHLTMQSHALSNKILTLTGRMSIFRGKHLREPEFLHIIEHDHLSHWLWGRYRFLSGDDKSTWYYLLKQGAEMFYIPDATAVTIENINGNTLDRMKENLKRWSGNTLRNGARAIALGPRKVGFFIWWCLIDQRCSIWTMFIGHMIVIILALSKSIYFLWIFLIWLAFSRLCISLGLFIYMRRIDMSFPFLIYINQFFTTIIKIYILFRLPQQRWKNRGDQHAGYQAQFWWKFKCWIANYLTAFYCLCFILVILIAFGLVSFPSMGDLITLFI